MQVGRIRFLSWPYRLAEFDSYRCHKVGADTILSVSYRSANALGPNHSPCHTGWPDPIPIHAIQVGQCSWPKSLLRAIQGGQIGYLSMSYRWANQVGPNHFPVGYECSGGAPSS